ncbi:Metal-dependent hydrolase, endonuclease/exonuclease/phosphatase family [Microbacterium sp. Nx66]|uniref:endonuclease/exonuclease/phosphatase family protein n=1 Tax=Microbacterium sp. Nx66 TaxID=2766784 RepID=UPI001656E597|nr:endonuclease/exonuclease/phosphatase family protein [Microbacterium sp. Nx66]CAD5140117.1 Metal-dependent hydrolase, endonuclease/exonuclease/phosphatase family [Microbacterium sp. Nx66]
MTAPLLGSPSTTELHVMTLNIRRDLGALAWPPADRWSVRRPRLTALLRAERPEVLGVQEALPAQAAEVSAALGPSFHRVGHGRLAGPRGEGCPLFYDADRLELGGWRQVALSRTPDRPGSRSWLSVSPRVVVEASFRDRRTGAALTVLNTHLDAFSLWARLRQAQAVHDVAAAAESPVVLVGDFNAPAGTAPWRALEADDVLRDSWTAAVSRRTPAWRTFAGYRSPRRGRRIDGILTFPALPVRRAGINARQYGGGWPSDHLAVQALIDLAPGAIPPEETA